MSNETKNKDVYYFSREKNTIKNQIVRILLVFETGLNIRQIARKLKIDKSCVAARLNELKNHDFINIKDDLHGIKALYESLDGVTNRTVTYWGIRKTANKVK